jgi:hypothetical protein
VVSEVGDTTVNVLSPVFVIEYTLLSPVPVVQFKYTVSPVFRPCAVKVTVIVVEADCAYVPVENVLLNTPT